MKSRHCGTWKPHDVSRVHLPFSNRRDGGGSVTFVGFFGLLMGLLGALFAFAQPTRARITVFVFCYLMHVAAAVFYHELVKSGGGDAAFYYYDPGRIFDNGFGPNTAFIIYLVQFPKTLFGGTFLDYFLVFQAVGFWGLVFLMRTLEEVYSEAEVDQPWTSIFCCSSQACTIGPARWVRIACSFSPSARPCGLPCSSSAGSSCW
jgi:hypothetical protein